MYVNIITIKRMIPILFSRKHYVASDKRHRREIYYEHHAHHHRHLIIFKHKWFKTGIALVILVPLVEREDQRKKYRRKCQKERLPLRPDLWNHVTMVLAKALKMVA